MTVENGFDTADASISLTKFDPDEPLRLGSFPP
jgi:hypothetical protein